MKQRDAKGKERDLLFTEYLLDIHFDVITCIYFHFTNIFPRLQLLNSHVQQSRRDHKMPKNGHCPTRYTKLEKPRKTVLKEICDLVRMSN